MGIQSGSMLERRARIFNVQKYSIYDGPGIRTLVFFKGCPLRCKWCSNPEGLEKKYQVMFKEDLCSNCGRCIPVCPMQIHSANPRHTVSRSIDCIGCRKCESVCPKQALNIAGSDKTVSEVLEIIQRDMLFYLSSGGGVTLGGGEVTAQPEFAANLLMECKQMGIHTAIETCGYTKLESLLMIARFTDLFLYDLKQIDSDLHYQLTGVRNERILDNLAELIRRGFQVRVRMPLIKNLNDSEETIRNTTRFLETFKYHKNFQGIDLLPYHKLGISKYRQLDMKYPIDEDLSLDPEKLAQIKSLLEGGGLQVNVIKH